MSNSIVAALKTHTILVIQGFQSGETSSIPGACVPPAAEVVPLSMALSLD